MRRRQVVTIEIYMFGRVAPDGRLRRLDQLTRIVPEHADLKAGTARASRP
ncbi:hypothetical protein ACN27G_28375 [Plantactinospora sp. WMMB334]